MANVIVQSSAVANWIPAIKNTDGSALQTGEITGYHLGVRPSSGTVGTYPVLAPVVGATAVSEPLTALASVLVPGDYAAAVRSEGPTNSAWSAEFAFTIAQPVPNPPTGFTIA